MTKTTKESEKTQTLARLDTKIRKLNDEMRDMVKDEIRQQTKSGEIHKAIQEQVQTAVEDSLVEREERARRKNNLMVFNLPESQSTDNNERQRKDQEEIKKSAKKLEQQTSRLTQHTELGSKE